MNQGCSHFGTEIDLYLGSVCKQFAGLFTWEVDLDLAKLLVVKREVLQVSPVLG